MTFYTPIQGVKNKWVAFFTAPIDTLIDVVELLGVRTGVATISDEIVQKYGNGSKARLVDLWASLTHPFTIAVLIGFTIYAMSTPFVSVFGKIMLNPVPAVSVPVIVPSTPSATPMATLVPTSTPTETKTPTPTSTLTPTPTLEPIATPTTAPTEIVLASHQKAYQYIYSTGCVMHNDVPDPWSSQYIDYTVKVLAAFKKSPEFISSGLAGKLSKDYYLGSGADGGCWRIIEFSGSGTYRAVWYQNTPETWRRIAIQEK